MTELLNPDTRKMKSSEVQNYNEANRKYHLVFYTNDILTEWEQKIYLTLTNLQSHIIYET